MPPPAEGFASRLFLGPALRTQPDRRLVTLVREEYETAFEEIVRRYGKPLSRYAASIVGGRSEDVTQDAFSKALLALRRDDAEIELRPWLFRIVRNTALNDLRDSPPSPEILAEAIVGGGNPVEELERREELADLMKRLQALPEPQRAAIVMRELEGLGHEEIAAALGLTGGGARQAIYRARQTLRDGMGVLIPLPLLQAMLAGGGTGAAETAAGAAGIGTTAGAGVALKATAATVLVAGAVGAGVALKDNPRSDNAKAAPARVSGSSVDATASAPSIPARYEEGSGGADNRDHDQGGAELGNDLGSHGEAKAEEGGGGEHALVDDHGGRGGTSDHRGESSGPSGGDDHSGSSGSGGSGPGDGGASGSSHSGPGPSDDSGSGDGGSGSSGSGKEGSGSGSSEDSSGSGPGPSSEPALGDGSSSSGSDPTPADHSGSGDDQPVVPAEPPS
ncbi:MAG TPA: sigma-70 family RNA polymerase sigma factor [Solirubrobacterales bacterium]|nr:sigma-70 family RNA polymerase sigma factor [Solirubrobacterales bacterium]